MEYKHFVVKVENGVATCTINRPEVLNAMNMDCWVDMGRFADWASETDEVKVVVITGAGEKAFVAGADINALNKRKLLEGLGNVAQRSCERVEKCTKPTIAAMNGMAFGGGLELALSCDIRIGVDNLLCGLPEVGLGILPAGGGTQRLAKLVGQGWAKDIILTGRRLKAEEAFRLGIITRMVAPDKLADEVKKVTEMITSKAPVAVRLAKQAVNFALSTDQEAGMVIEGLTYSILLGTEDKNEGTGAFIEKRNPNFKGQ